MLKGAWQDFIALLDESGGRGQARIVIMRLKEFFAEAVAAHADEDVHHGIKREFSVSREINAGRLDKLFQRIGHEADKR